MWVPYEQCSGTLGKRNIPFQCPALKSYFATLPSPECVGAMRVKFASAPKGPRALRSSPKRIFAFPTKILPARRPSQAQPLRRSLRLVSKYASLRLASGPVPQPACWRVLRVCDWPQAQSSQQLATQPQAQVCMKQALPIQQPAQAQLSPARPAQVPGATRSVVRLPGSQQPTYGRPRRISEHASHYRPPAPSPPAGSAQRAKVRFV